MSGRTKTKWADKTWDPIRDGGWEQPLYWRVPARVSVEDDLFHEHVPDKWLDEIFAVMALAPHHTFILTTKRPERMRQYLMARNGIGNSALCTSINSIPSNLGDRRGALSMPLPNVWLGVSVEDQPSADERISIILDTPAAVRWVNFDPALEHVDLSSLTVQICNECGKPVYVDSFLARKRCCCTEGPEPVNRAVLDWVVVGGESGPGARPCNVEWIRSIVEQCREAGVACFVKQLGARPLMGIHDIPGELYRELEANGLDLVEIHKAVRERRTPLRHRKGADPSEWPEDLQVQEYPATKVVDSSRPNSLSRSGSSVRNQQ